MSPDPPPVQRSEDELHVALAEQASFLQTSSRLYDEGQPWEAKRLATTIRTLCHKGLGHPLLKQLGVRDKLSYASAAVQDGSGSSALLYSLEVNSSIVDGRPHQELLWKPNLIVTDHLDFQTWWNVPVISAGGTSFTRWELVKGPANQDGGAHVDPTLESKYAALSRGEVGGVIYFGDGSTDVYIEAHNNPVLAAVRTIAFELMTTLDEQMMAFVPASLGGTSN